MTAPSTVKGASTTPVPSAWTSPIRLPGMASERRRTSTLAAASREGMTSRAPIESEESTR